MSLATKFVASSLALQRRILCLRRDRAHTKSGTGSTTLRRRHFTSLVKQPRECRVSIDQDADSCLHDDNHDMDESGTDDSSSCPQFRVLWGLSSKRNPIVNCTVHRPACWMGPAECHALMSICQGTPCRPTEKRVRGDGLTLNVATVLSSLPKSPTIRC